ncbi:MAG: PEP-CTERM sorting domain-containing protein [Phycisphaerae bacterium]|nr:PEP-CTERM sorting domain-containing protein [Phycisphaerae bacterium]
MGKLNWGVPAGLITIAVLLTAGAYAGLEVLPESTHYQGSQIQGNYRIDFAVYDTQGGNEFAAQGFVAPGEGRYTYVYQLFNISGAANFGIEYFQISGISQGAVSNQSQIGSADDLAGGIAAEDAYFDASLTKGAWEFENGTLIVGKHSAFLVISSNNDWAAGGYTIDRSSEFPVPGGDGNEVPEPMTLLLLGMGGFGLLGSRRSR